jgi:protein-disulfide isomerase
MLALAPVAPAAAQLAAITPKGLSMILARPDSPFAGAAAGDVTIVEYLDFNCPYCKKYARTLAEVTAADRRVRVLYKDWPIFGEASRYAARATLAARWQDRYLAAHNVLIDSPARLASPADVRAKLTAAGIDMARLDSDLNAHAAEIDAILARNDQEARALAFEGTPGLVVGPYVVGGALDADMMRRLIAVVREGEAQADSAAPRKS